MSTFLVEGTVKDLSKRGLIESLFVSEFKLRLRHICESGSLTLARRCSFGEDVNMDCCLRGADDWNCDLRIAYEESHEQIKKLMLAKGGTAPDSSRTKLYS